MMVHWFCRWEDDGTAPGAQAREACQRGVDAWLFELSWQPGQPLAIPDAMHWLAAEEQPPLGYGVQWQAARPLSPAEERQAMQELLPWLLKPAAVLPLGQAVLLLAELELLSSTRWALPRIRQSLSMGFESVGQRPPLLLALEGASEEGRSKVLDGRVASAVPKSFCQRVGNRWNYESHLANAHWQSRTQTVKQQSVKAISNEEDDKYVHATADAYREWLRQSLAWTSLARMDKPELSWILLESWKGHQRWGPRSDQIQGYKHSSFNSATITSAAASACRRTKTNWYQLGKAVQNNPALFIHGFYPDILDRILESLPKEAKTNWTLYLSTSADHFSLVKQIAIDKQWHQGIVVGCENQGRDMAPFIHDLLPEALEMNHPWGLKLHTKYSDHLNDGAAWSRQLLQSLTTNQTVQKLNQLFEQDPQLGLIAPAGCLLPMSVHLDRNIEWLRTVAQAHHLDGEWLADQVFPAGSMYAFRPKALEPLMEWQALIPPMEAECGQHDGTWAHAMERLVGISCRRAGMRVTELQGYREGVPHFAYRQALTANHTWA